MSDRPTPSLCWEHDFVGSGAAGSRAAPYTASRNGLAWRYNSQSPSPRRVQTAAALEPTLMPFRAPRASCARHPMLQRQGVSQRFSSTHIQAAGLGATFSNTPTTPSAAPLAEIRSSLGELTDLDASVRTDQRIARLPRESKSVRGEILYTLVLGHRETTKLERCFQQPAQDIALIRGYSGAPSASMIRSPAAGPPIVVTPVARRITDDSCRFHAQQASKVVCGAFSGRSHLAVTSPASALLRYRRFRSANYTGHTWLSV